MDTLHKCTGRGETNEYEAIVCDLDGTLLNEKHQLSDETKEVIKKVKDTGKKIFIVLEDIT